MSDINGKSSSEFLDEPKNATIREEYVKCGRPNCNKLHGPYRYAYWRENGKLKKKYLGKKDCSPIFRAFLQARGLRPSEYRKWALIREAAEQGIPIAQKYKEKLMKKEVTLDWAYRRVREGMKTKKS